MSKIQELAWAAGFFDGEGNASFKRGKRGKGTVKEGHAYTSFYAKVTQKDPTLLYRFQKALGVGRVRGPYKNKGKKGRKASSYYQFVVSSYPDVEKLFNLLGPWLGEKKLRQLGNVLGQYFDRKKRP